MNRIYHFLTLPLIVVLFVFQTVAQTPVSFFSNDEVKLNPSWIKQREALNTAYLHQLDPERLLHNFRVNAGLPSSAKPLEGWESPNIGLRGHFTGHFLSACAILIKSEEDSLLANKNVIALYYGPVLLAFKTTKELILKGNQEEILHSVSKQPNEFSFSLKNNGMDYKLVPFYQLTNESYGVYATIRNEY